MILLKGYVQNHYESHETNELVCTTKKKLDEAMILRDKTMILYGVFKLLYKESLCLTDKKKQLKMTQSYESEMDKLNNNYKLINQQLQQYSLYLLKMDITHPISVITETIDEGILLLFTPYTYERLVEMEKISYLANEKKRVELRVPIGLLTEIDKYQTLNNIPSRTQTIFELCRISLHQ